MGSIMSEVSWSSLRRGARLHLQLRRHHGVGGSRALSR